MPNNSFWPLVAAAGVAMIFAGFLVPYSISFMPVISALGIIVLIGSIYGWSFEPVG